MTDYFALAVRQLREEFPIAPEDAEIAERRQREQREQLVTTYLRKVVPAAVAVEGER